MKTYIVETHVGDFETTAATPQKALANIRWRVFGGRVSAQYTRCWKVEEAKS